MRVALGADHAGFELKGFIATKLSESGHEVTDYGTNSADSVDYPDFAERVATDVSTGAADRGVLFCGTGIGMAIAANKVNGVRAANPSNPEEAALAREHNDANVLCIGARFVGEDLALEILEAWMGASFGGGRHIRRVGKIARIEDREAASRPPGALDAELAEIESDAAETS